MIDFDYRIQAGAMSTVMPASLVNGLTFNDFKEVVNSGFTLNGVNQPGTVHAWRYVDGDVRVTFRPHG